MKLASALSDFVNWLSKKPAPGISVRAFFDDLRTTFPGLDLQLVTPLAKGADTMVNRIALKMDIEMIAGVRDAYAHKKAEKELIRQYDFMSRIFSNAGKLLESSTDYRFKRRVLRALGEAALEEGAEWILMQRERPLEYGRL